MVAKCKECGSKDWEQIDNEDWLPLWQCKNCKRVISENKIPLLETLDIR